MTRLVGLTVAVLLACAPPQSAVTSGWGGQQDTPVGVVSHHRSDVDVYLLCGDHDALSLGVVPAGGFQAFEIPAPRRRCVLGLNFFLVVRSSNRGYWVGPLYPGVDSYVRLVVERYAGLSTVSLLRN
jgi:hypothetical protein